MKVEVPPEEGMRTDRYPVSGCCACVIRHLTVISSTREKPPADVRKAFPV